MPPKKEVKEKAAKGDEAEEMVIQYLKGVNRPYASTDVSANLKGKVPKALAQKIMQAQSEKGILTLKPYGKQTIFVYNQSLLKVMSPEEMALLDEQLKTAVDEMAEKRKLLAGLEKELANMESAPKTKDLPRTLEEAKSNNDAITATLAPFRSSGETAVKPLTDEERLAIDGEFSKWRKAWVDRRNTYKLIFGALEDSEQVRNKLEFEEAQGIELDSEETTAIDKGEFCNPTLMRRPAPKTTKSAVTKPILGSNNIVNTQGEKKRLQDAASADADGGKKKKVKTK